jgi:rhodanese-related sulfurtransferase
MRNNCEVIGFSILSGGSACSFQEEVMQRNKNVLSAMSIFLTYLFTIMACALPIYGAEQEFTTVTSERLKAMIEAKKDFVLIDARTVTEYQEAHIVGAISIPDNKFDESLALLPKEKSSLLVFYCNGVKCGKSKKSAIKASAAGYKNIDIYSDGFPVWEEKGLNIVPGPDYSKKVETTVINPVDLKKMIDGKNQDFVIVDVRDEAEYKEGHIPGAISIPVDGFASRSGVLPKEKKIIVYCNTGGSSYSAYRKLIKLAYPFIAQAKFVDWKEAKMPVEK